MGKRLFLISVLAALLLVALPICHGAQTGDGFPLGEHGPYGVGRRQMTFIDEHRDGRELETMIWYPAAIPEGQQESAALGALPDAEPDSSNGPYPLIIYSHYRGGNNTSTLDAGPHLASHGFVVVSASHNDNPDWLNLVNRPLDVVFLINALAALTDDPLVGLIDTDNVGVTGYSFGGRTALMVSGAQIDPVSYEEACPASQRLVGQFDLCYYRYAVWDELVAYRAQFDALPEGEPWPAITDERIRAVVPMAVCYGPLYGERGLSGVRVPTMLIGMTQDQLCPYERDSVYIYEHLGIEERYLITLVGPDHAQPISSSAIHKKLNHFATAFFGYYLQGREDYGQYLTADSVSQFEDVVWGPVTSQGE